MTKPRRRQAGEGGISEYVTKAGPRFLIKYRYIRDDGSMASSLKRGYLTRKDAAAALREKLSTVERGTHVAPNKVTVGAHFATWLDGLRLEPSTVASYRRYARLHIVPHLGALRLDQLTGTRLTSLYHQLETSGRVDGQGGLSARTVRYIHTIVHAAMNAAVRDGALAVNPADKADPPSAKSAVAPEMKVWSAGEVRAFLAQRAEAQDELLFAWVLLVSTGMRRGEAIALRWGDVDFAGSRLSVRRSAQIVKNKGMPTRTVIRPPKSNKPRVIDLDPGTLAALKAHKVAQGTISLSLARDDVYVLADLTGGLRSPHAVYKRFIDAVTAASKTLREPLPRIRLHDLRHTHATLLLRAGVPVKVVSERLGHANAMITLGVYAHVMPGMQAEAAAKFGELLSGEEPPAAGEEQGTSPGGAS